MHTTLNVPSINLYSVFDCVGQEYGPPFLSKSDATAVRVYRQMMSREHVVGTDYKLFRLGAFNSETGTIIPDILEEIEAAMDFSDIKNAFPGSKEAKK